MENRTNNSLTKTDTHTSSVSAIVHEIDGYYKQGTVVYAEGIGRYKVEIEKLQNKIEDLIANKQKDEDRYKDIEQELVISARLLEHLQDEFMHKIHSIDELNIEYKDVLEASEYNTLIVRKSKELHRAEDEIESLEYAYLNYELERINQLEALKPKRKEIEMLKRDIKELELEKEYFASTKLHQLPLMGAVHTEIDDENAVDADIV